MGTEENRTEMTDRESLKKVWELVYKLVKIVTGDVNINTDGNLQSQIKKIAADTNKIQDDSTEQEYKLGVENGLVYIQEVKK